MKTESMELNDHSPSGVFYTIALCVVTLLSKFFHFSLTAFVYKISHFSLSVSLSNLMDIPVSDAARYIDAFFHYSLLTVSLAFGSIRFYDYIIARKKKSP